MTGGLDFPAPHLENIILWSSLYTAMANGTERFRRAFSSTHRVVPAAGDDEVLSNLGRAEQQRRNGVVRGLGQRDATGHRGAPRVRQRMHEGRVGLANSVRHARADRARVPVVRSGIKVRNFPSVDGHA